MVLKKNILWLLFIFLIASCTGKEAGDKQKIQEESKTLADTGNQTSEIKQSDTESGLKAEPEELESAPRALSENEYLPEDLPEEIYYKLSGAWTILAGEPEDEREFSWGTGRYHFNAYFIIDFRRNPPILEIGSQGGAVLEILTVEDLGNDQYKINVLYRHRKKEAVFMYIININPDGTMWVEETDDPELVPGKQFIMHKTSGPEQPSTTQP